MIDLNTDITKISRVGQATAKKLRKIGLNTVSDLLFYFPYKYEDYRETTPINKLTPEISANVVGKIELIQNKRSFRKKMYITESLVSDETGQIKVIWFNQPFIAKSLKVGDTVSLAGKVKDDYGGFSMVSPAFEKLVYGQPVHTQGLVPIYHLTSNITQKQIRFLIKQIIELSGKISEVLPKEITKRQALLSINETIKKIHFPKNYEDAEKARQRLGFEELFFLQLESQFIKNKFKKTKANPVPFSETETKKFVNSLSFKLTDAQRKASWEILKDLEKEKPMTRLLEGDVGSGKTLVAVIAMLNVALRGHQSALMVPTEILARQHFENISKLLSPFNIKVGLITGSSKNLNFEQEIANVKISKKNKFFNHQFIIHNSQIIIGTHALIQEKIKFKNLSLAVIDEQHRFGVEQRAKLFALTNADTGRTNTDYVHISPRQSAKVGVSPHKEGDKLLYEDLTYKIRGAAYKIKKELGLSHKEIVYQNALKEEFKNLGLNFEKEKTINVKYENKKVGVYRPDFVVEDKIILEIKKLPFIGKIERKQVWHYLKGSDYKLALIINFGNSDVQIERIIFDNARVSPQKSAQSQHQSALGPHLLSMTATPIPRSLALALFGDLDISVINELPAGRKKIITKAVSEENREKAYGFIRDQIKSGRQIFVICPLIDISDKLGVKSVKEEYEKLNNTIFPEIEIGMLHGWMKPKEKEEVMNNFLNKKIKILVSTSVVEVGVDAPNASLMMIEGADRFGLAQLHQFRGRVGRAEHQSYCLLFTDSQSPKTLERLEILSRYHDGFTLAKMDLKYRGPGEVFGLAQKGFPELKIASLFDYALIKKAKEEAEIIIKEDPNLINHPLLKIKIEEKNKPAHPE